MKRWPSMSLPFASARSKHSATRADARWWRWRWPPLLPVMPLPLARQAVSLRGRGLSLGACSRTGAGKRWRRAWASGGAGACTKPAKN